MSEFIGLTFEILVRSTGDLHMRFGTQQTVAQSLACLSEEVAELAYEVELLSGPHKFVAGEAADVIVTLLGVLRAAGVDDGQLAAAMLAVAKKNDAKTHMTHAINSEGKIARKGD